MHEIITLQLGQASNYVATHFWNTQESYFSYADDDEEPSIDHNIHWRPGRGADGAETFLPRTVVYDLKGGFGSLRKINALYDPGDDPSAALSWDGASVTHKLPPVAPTAYQQSLDAGLVPPELDESHVRYWSDFSRTFYHPKSLNQLYDYELNSSIRPFDKWPLGQELFQSLDKEHDIADRDFRPFVEEADQMQAIQVFTSLDDAWGGFAAEYLDRMRDEYPKATILVWGLHASQQSRLHLTNVARSTAALCEHASLVIPMRIPRAGLPSNVRLNSDSPWQTSALMATAMETAGLSSRAKFCSSRYTLGHLTERLNQSGKQTLARLQMSASASSTTPLEPRDSRTGKQMASDEDLPLDIDLLDLAKMKPRPSPDHSQPHVFGRERTCRGWYSLARGQQDEADVATSSARTGRATEHVHSFDIAFPLLDSFPKIYTAQEKEPNESVGVETCLSTDSAVSEAVDGLRTLTTPLLGIEDRENISNDLAELAEAYRDGWSSGSDDGDDI
ncbi:hypothetical protein BN1708_010875 [Verticillium longisporum]|uniref:DML1/Misato tubulin domain-containing protein n=1 Tax=Verticillium longisporum TaxID=100787 RepID=A0A0G4KV09_VERLO|nr:Protein dml-1 like protein [Verticillium longisporum]CRK13582.1 hypothetical protein BN1708_010875 [Verticillium longisporum]